MSNALNRMTTEQVNDFEKYADALEVAKELVRLKLGGDRDINLLVSIANTVYQDM